MDWLSRFEHEIDQAQRARARGNEGQARVCARRAAGILGAEYLARRGTPTRTRSALDVLQQLRADEHTPPSAQTALVNLVLTVDQEFNLPAGIDLIAEARRLRLLLLGGPESAP